MERRNFLTAAAAAPLAGAAAKEYPKRLYKDGIQLSIVGFGGIVVMGQDQPEADRVVAASVDRGINYFDVAPSYGDGEAEIKLGPALKPHRKRVFLACKTGKRDAAGAQQELDRSLQRLHTDYFDLYQFHAVSSRKDVDQILGKNGAAETFRKAKQAGKVRYLGFSAHDAKAAIALMDAFPCDSILFPVNFAAFAVGNFGPQILAHARQNGIARLALKAMARGRWPQGANRDRCSKCWYEPVDDPALAEQAVRFTLSEDITAAIPPGDAALYDRMVAIGASFRPITPSERKELFAKATGVEPIFRA